MQSVGVTSKPTPGAHDHTGRFRVRVKAVRALKDVDLTGNIEIMGLGNQACPHQWIRGLRKRSRAIQDETHAVRHSRNIGRVIEREHL